MSNYIPLFNVDVIIYPCPSFDAGQLIHVEHQFPVISSEAVMTKMKKKNVSHEKIYCAKHWNWIIIYILI